MANPGLETVLINSPDLFQRITEFFSKPRLLALTSMWWGVLPFRSGGWRNYSGGAVAVTDIVLDNYNGRTLPIQTDHRTQIRIVNIPR